MLTVIFRQRNKENDEDAVTLMLMAVMFQIREQGDR